VAWLAVNPSAVATAGAEVAAAAKYALTYVGGHAHYNETETLAHLIPIQDAGLQTYLRSLDIKFTQRRDLVAG
jgi:hypothetical protein